MIKTLIADPHPVVREGIRHSFERSSDLTVKAEANTAQELLDGLSGAIDSVIADANLPGRESLALLEEIKRRRPSLPVVVYAATEDQELALRCLRAGAAAFLAKDSSLELLAHAVRSTQHGKKFLTPSMAAHLAAQSCLKQPRQELSSREFQVLRGIAHGMALKEVAAQLCLSPKTISTYRDRLLQKLNAHSNADLVRYSIRFLEPPPNSPRQ